MALGSAFQASVGIGLALFAVTLLALVDQSFAPGPMPRAGVTRIDDSLPRTQDNDVPALRSSLVGLAVGAIAGAVALRFASGPLLGKTFWRIGAAGIFTEAYRLQTHCNSSFVDDYRWRRGHYGGHSRDPWPAISLVFQNAESRVARGMLGAFFSVAYLGALAALAAFGLFEVPQIVRTSASAGATGAECCERPACPVTRYASDNGSV